jgi:hypothetical protein
MLKVPSIQSRGFFFVLTFLNLLDSNIIFTYAQLRDTRILYPTRKINGHTWRE